VHLSVSEIDNELTDEALFAGNKNWLQFLHNFAKHLVHDKVLVLTRQFIPESVLLDYHVKVVFYRGKGSLTEDFKHLAWIVVRRVRILHVEEPPVDLRLLLVDVVAKVVLGTYHSCDRHLQHGEDDKAEHL